MRHRAATSHRQKSLNLVGVSSVYLTVYGTALWPEVVLDCPRIMACIG